jgi:hypothetical protein
MERVGRLLCLVLLLSLPFVLAAVLVLLVLHPLGGLPATGSRHTMVPGRDRGTQSTHGTRVTLQLLLRDRGIGPSAAQAGFTLRHGQQLTLYWEWRAGASLPPGTYTVRVVLCEAARPGRLVASGTATTPLSVKSP